MLLQFSIFILSALAAAKLCKLLRLPPLVGMIGVGIVLGRYAGELWIDKLPLLSTYRADLQISPTLLGLSSELRGLALVIILIRAGLGIQRNDLKIVGAPAIKMSVLPAMVEALFICMASTFLLNFSLLEGGLLGFVLAAVSPAVIVPKMLQLIDHGIGMAKKIPTLVLAGASLDDVLAITCFGVLLKLASNDSSGWAISLVKAPFGVLIGIVLGGLIAMVLIVVFRKSHLRDTEKMLILLLVAIIFRHSEHWSFIPVCSLIGIMVMGFVLLEKNPSLGKVLSQKFNHLWIGAELMLFALVGAEVDPRVIWHVGLWGLLLLGIGLMGRSIGVFLSLLKTPLNRQERWFCVMAYLPKATVQAAIGGVVLESLRKGDVILPGAESTGQVILAMAVLSILVTAPLGAILMERYSEKLLKD